MLSQDGLNITKKIMQSSVTEFDKQLTVPVKFWEFRLPESQEYPIEQVHLDIENVIRQSGDVRKRTTNVKAIMTDWLMTDHRCFKVVADCVENIIQQWYQQNTSLDLETFMTTCWGSIYGLGDYSEPHAHTPALYSWVYYVKVSERTSPIRFLSDPSWTYYPKTGDGIIFPGWLQHETPQQLVDEDRVIVVGNVEGTGGVTYPQVPRKFLKVK